MKMKSVLLLAIIVMFIALEQSVAQTPFDQRLIKDYLGTIPHSNMFNGKDMKYQLAHKRYDGKMYYYNLILSSNGSKDVIIPLLVRNLLNSAYFEFTFNNQPKIVLMGIYSKTRKWLRIKGNVSEKCKIKGEEWARIDGLEDYSELVLSILKEMDANVDISCIISEKH
ncbi:MAG: hypothetical protein K9G46_00630 [Flavobacteriales bacterium]|nr:hypothetical protein [Flavobacteriales bacterium]